MHEMSLFMSEFFAVVKIQGKCFHHKKINYKKLDIMYVICYYINVKKF